MRNISKHSGVNSQQSLRPLPMHSTKNTYTYMLVIYIVNIFHMRRGKLNSEYEAKS